MNRQEGALYEFGRRITRLRLERGLSVGELASRADLDSRELADIEAGECDIPLTTIFRLAGGLDMLPGQLLAWL